MAATIGQKHKNGFKIVEIWDNHSESLKNNLYNDFKGPEHLLGGMNLENEIYPCQTTVRPFFSLWLFHNPAVNNHNNPEILLWTPPLCWKIVLNLDDIRLSSFHPLSKLLWSNAVWPTGLAPPQGEADTVLTVCFTHHSSGLKGVSPGRPRSIIVSQYVI